VSLLECYEEAARQAFGKAGARASGYYEYCSYTLSGTGRFRPTAEAPPYIGEAASVAMTSESKVALVVRKNEKDRVITAMMLAHPDEEVAYAVFTLENKESAMGLGRVGTLEHPMALSEFADWAKQQLDVPSLRMVGDPNATIKKVAVL